MSELTVVEFKFKLAGCRWEDTPVASSCYYSGDYAEVNRMSNKHAEVLSDKSGVEVRWNRQGSTQGHYIMSQATQAARLQALAEQHAEEERQADRMAEYHLAQEMAVERWQDDMRAGA